MSQGGAITPEEFKRAMSTESSSASYSGGTITPNVYDVQNFLISASALRNFSPEDETAKSIYYDHYKFNLYAMKDNYKLQRIYGGVILAATLLVLSVGLAISYMQFRTALYYGEQINTNLTISTTSVVISTSLVGGVVLVFSLVFFYLFLTQVFNRKITTYDPENLLKNLKNSQKL